MNESPRRHSDPVRFILHPTDFSAESELAFAHALRLAVTNRGHLSLLHVEEESEVAWERFPAVRQTLERWGLIDVNARRSDIADIGLGVEKLVIHDDDVAHAIEKRAAHRSVDLLVLATHNRRGLSTWLKPSVAQQAARQSSLPTLFVPAQGHGCVSMQDGRVTMNHVLVPVDHSPRSDDAIERGLRAIEAYGTADSRLTLLHVGSEGTFPDVEIPPGNWKVERVEKSGEPASVILDAAKQGEVNLIIMVTEGTHGFLDMLRGSTTERVLHQSPCPVLAVPADHI